MFPFFSSSLWWVLVAIHVFAQIGSSIALHLYDKKRLSAYLQNGIIFIYLIAGYLFGIKALIIGLILWLLMGVIVSNLIVRGW